MDELDIQTDSSTGKNLVGAVILGAAIYGAYEATKTIGRKVVAWNRSRKTNETTKTTLES